MFANSKRPFSRSLSSVRLRRSDPSDDDPAVPDFLAARLAWTFRRPFNHPVVRSLSPARRFSGDPNGESGREGLPFRRLVKRRLLTALAGSDALRASEYSAQFALGLLAQVCLLARPLSLVGDPAASANAPTQEQGRQDVEGFAEGVWDSCTRPSRRRRVASSEALRASGNSAQFALGLLAQVCLLAHAGYRDMETGVVLAEGPCPDSPMKVVAEASWPSVRVSRPFLKNGPGL